MQYIKLIPTNVKIISQIKYYTLTWPFKKSVTISLGFCQSVCHSKGDSWISPLPAYCVQVVNRQGKPYYEIHAGEKPEFVAPADVSKAILLKMKGKKLTDILLPHWAKAGVLIISFFTETAQSALGSDVNDAVFTVPFEFSHSQEQALRCAIVLYFLQIKCVTLLVFTLFSFSVVCVYLCVQGRSWKCGFPSVEADSRACCRSASL